jgi:hypothetical protein
LRPLLACLAFLLLPACGPIVTTSAIIDADVELEGARAAGAKRTAVYEFTAAEAYLHKAREIAGYSVYAPATDFANKARDFAREARKKALAASNRPAVAP